MLVKAWNTWLDIPVLAGGGLGVWMVDFNDVVATLTGLAVLGLVGIRLHKEVKKLKK